MLTEIVVINVWINTSDNNDDYKPITPRVMGL